MNFIVCGAEAHSGGISECFYVMIVIGGLTGSVLIGIPYFDNGDVVLQTDIV